jgi:hypothetical protein
MDYDVLIEGLKARGFQYTEDIGSKGHCHYDERHFILLTDGLVIYSNFWNWNACNKKANDFGGVEGGLCEIWCLEPSEFDTKTKEFTFEELDFIMK